MKFAASQVCWLIYSGSDGGFSTCSGLALYVKHTPKRNSKGPLTSRSRHMEEASALALAELPEYLELQHPTHRTLHPEPLEFLRPGCCSGRYLPRLYEVLLSTCDILMLHDNWMAVITMASFWASHVSGGHITIEGGPQVCPHTQDPKSWLIFSLYDSCRAIVQY